jgi:hypothetical protein
MGTSRTKSAQSNVTDIRPRRQADAQAVDALHDTVRLVHDLAEALAAQTARARRQIEGLGPPGATADLVGRLTVEAAQIKRHCEELAAALTTVDGTATGEDAPPADDESEPGRAPSRHEQNRRREASTTPRDSNPAETLAIDLKLEGMKPADVETFLVDTFGIDDAKAVVERVFGISKT